MELDRQNLVLFHDYTKGSAYDYSGNGNSGTLTNSEGFIENKNGWAFKPQADNGVIIVSDSSSLQLTEGSFYIYGDFNKDFVLNGVFVDKRDSGGTNYLFYTISSTDIRFYDGTSDSVFTVAKSDYENAKVIALTKSSGASKAKLYFDGVFHSEASINTTLTADDAPLFIGNRESATLGDEMTWSDNAIAIYNVEHTAQEVDHNSRGLMQLKTPITGSRPKDSLGSQGSQPLWSGQKAGWNLQKNAGKVLDNIGSNHGTPIGSVTQVRTPLGEPALDFDGSTGYVTCGTNSSLNFTTETFGGYCWVNATSMTTTMLLMCRGFDMTDGYFFQLSAAASGLLYMKTNQAGAGQIVQSNVALATNREYLVGFLSIAGGNNKVYLNGVDVSASAIARTDPLTSARNFRLGAYDDLSFKYNGKKTKPVIGTFSSQAEYEAELKKEYNRVANKAMYKQNFEAAAIMQSAIGSGTLPGTKHTVYDGTHKISYDSTFGKKCIEGVTAGKVRTSVPQGNSAFGTFEFSLYRHSSTEVEHHFITTATKAGYSIRMDLNGYVWLIRNNANFSFSAGLFFSSVGYTSVDTWYNFRVTRSTEYVFNVYIKGGAYASWTHIPVGVGGANPATDSSYITNVAQYTNLGAGDKVADITKKFGVSI